MWSRATFGSHSCFCSSEPKCFSGSGRPIDWCAESSVDERRVPDPGQRQRAVVVDLREAEAAVLARDLHPERAELLEALDRRRRGSSRPARSAAGRRAREERRAARRGTPRPSRDALGGRACGCGWIRSSRKLPRKSSLPKLGSFHSRLAALLGDLLGLFIAWVVFTHPWIIARGGCYGAHAGANAGGTAPVICDRDLGMRAALPLGAEHRVHGDIAPLVVVAVERTEHPLTREPDLLQGPLGAEVSHVGV